MPDLNTAMPQWLVQEHFLNRQNNSGEKFLQGMQLGANIAQRNRQISLEERAMRLKEGSEMQQREGLIALGEVMSNATDAGTWDSPETERAVWGVVHKYPWLTKNEAFGAAMENFDQARKAKLRTEITDVTQQAITDRNQAAIQGRFDLLSQRLDSMTQLEGVKQEGRTALAEFKNELNMLRDQLKPTRPGEVFHDLPESEMVAMRSELTGLDNEYKTGRIKTTGGGIFNKEPKVTAEEQYRTRKQEIIARYSAKRISRPTAAPAAPAAPVAAATPAPPLAERQAGTIYQTPKGPYRWNGSGWEAP